MGGGFPGFMPGAGPRGFGGPGVDPRAFGGVSPGGAGVQGQGLNDANTDFKFDPIFNSSP